VCLLDGCYTLSIEDSYGDGMCCTYGDGGIEVMNDQGEIQISSDGQFGSYKDIEFCILDSEVQSTDVKSDKKDSSARLKAKEPRIRPGR